MTIEQEAARIAEATRTNRVETGYTVRPGDSYWRLSSRALGHDNVRTIVDFNKLDEGERAKIRDLTDLLQQQNRNKMLYAGDIISIAKD